jgi:hypothetical protein
MSTRYVNVKIPINESVSNADLLDESAKGFKQLLAGAIHELFSEDGFLEDGEDINVTIVPEVIYGGEGA